MGTLVAKHYPTILFAKAADHTYVECGTGAKGWACWGGKSGGAVLRNAAASTLRADYIAEPNEKAGITCYLINGVCHQAANRILLPGGITVTGARGYTVSNALFGAYGRVGTWPCSAPFNQWVGTTGDLPACVPSGVASIAAEESPLSDADQLDWNYVREVLAIYGAASPFFERAGARGQEASAALTRELMEFQVGLFAHMLDFFIGPMLDDGLRSRLLEVRQHIEQRRVELEAAYAAGRLGGPQFVDEFNRLTLELQEQMAKRMTSAQYETLFHLKRGEFVVLADPTITREVFGA